MQGFTGPESGSLDMPASEIGFREWGRERLDEAGVVELV